eukprot:GHVU01106363.1.p1 GENE.GHVU01106363.1~~GHVU01106363.1.p1  ORF type:complete len:158 (+),score=14.81 GHVU01106363.1:665-1138(+)
MNVKTTFTGYNELAYSGFIVSADGIRPDPTQIETIAQPTPPLDVSGVRRFLGAIGIFRKFIENFSKRAHPLYHLLKSDIAWIWSAAQSAAWEDLRKCLMTAPIVLTYVRPDVPSVLDTDAPLEALGAAFMLANSEGDLQVVAYASRVVGENERNSSS